jgi:hypothetical protein
MVMTKGRIEREGAVNFGDASIAIWEEGISAARAQSGHAGEQAWEKQFKREVFRRIVQMLRRLGWTCAVPEISQHDVKHYGGNVARWAAERRRLCAKGDLKANLEISGRCIKLDMFQNVNAPDRPDHDGRYQSNKEQHMPYLLRLEMERARRRIRDYLCNVLTGYVFREPEPKRGPNGLTALEYIQADVRSCWHYNKALDRRSGEDSCGNNRSADGAHVKHGARVWFADYKGRICTGTAFYNINNMWWVITGRYEARNVASFEIYTRCPENLRVKRNAARRRKRLEAELNSAVKAMKFERAALLRDILFQGDQQLFNVWHAEHGVYHRAGFSGYTADQSQAGKFTADEVRGWDRAPNKVVPLAELEAAV